MVISINSSLRGGIMRKILCSFYKVMLDKLGINMIYCIQLAYANRLEAKK